MELEKRVSELEKKMSGTFQAFGRAYSNIGSTDSDLLLKTKGQIKIQYGSTFIDLIKDGKINSSVDFIYQQNEVGNKDGIYILNNEDVVLKVGNNEISLVGNSGNTYVSFLSNQETTSEQKYTALTNIGFIYKSIKDIDISKVCNSIIYIEDQKELYIVQNGAITKYSIDLQTPYDKQIIIDKKDTNKGSLVIQGNNKDNSIAFDNLYLYTDSSGAYLDITGKLYYKLNEQIKIQIDNNTSIFNIGIKCDNIQSSSGSYKLYSQDGESTLEVDNLIVRNPSESDDILYPKYWYYKNNIIKSVEEQYDNLIKVSFVYNNEFNVGDYLYSYILQDLYTFKVVNIEDTLVTLEYYDDIPIYAISKQIVFLISTSNTISILKRNDNNIDIVEIEKPEDDNDQSRIKFRIGDISIFDNNLSYGIYSNQALFANIKYTDEYILEDNDNSSKLASTEWVNKKFNNLPGYYYSSNKDNNIPIYPKYIGITKGEVDSTNKYLWYYNGDWKLMDLYPEENKIYIKSTIKDIYPAGFICYSSNGITSAIGYGKSNYISNKGTLSILQNINNIANQGEIPNLDGFNILWSLNVNDDPTVYTNWNLEIDLLHPVVNSVDGDFGNCSSLNKVAVQVDDYGTILGNTTTFIGDIGTKENWSNKIWVKSFLSTIVSQFLINNTTRYSNTFGWNLNNEGNIYCRGYGGYWSAKIANIESPTSDSQQDSGYYPKSSLLYLQGNVTGNGITVTFLFNKVYLGNKTNIGFTNEGYLIGDKAEVYGILYDIDYEGFSANIVELSNPITQ